MVLLLNMWLDIFKLIVCLLILEKNIGDVGASDDDGKISNFKAKLAQEEFAKTLKKASSLQRYPDSGESSSPIDLGITLPAAYANETIKQDHHIYYNSTFYTNPKDGQHFWIDLNLLPEEHVITHTMLSDSHRQAMTIELSFDFPFYGSIIRNITIATGGFLYMGGYLHNWIAATQYVAPLMANFDTSLSGNSTIKYVDNGTSITVQWDKVYIQDRYSDGAFIFQCTLLKNGDIIFAYKEIPFSVLEISDEKHPVKIGISDAYILERSVFFVRRKTIYEYHRIDLLKKGISNGAAIYFTALTTCLDFKNCSSCLTFGKDLECMWCEAVQRCSDGVDRMRQSWVVNGCSVKSETSCPANAYPVGTVSYDTKEKTVFHLEDKSSTSTSSNALPSVTEISPNRDSVIFSNTSNEITASLVQNEIEEKSSHSISTGAIVTILVFLIIVISLSLWVFYAYKFPQTTSGQFLIKYRPSQWNFKQENNVRTTNSLHM